MKRVLVVGPWAGTGGVHTFMRNLCILSNLKERWEFKQFDLSRPPKKTIDNNAYNFLSSATADNDQHQAAPGQVRRPGIGVNEELDHQRHAQQGQGR